MCPAYDGGAEPACIGRLPVAAPLARNLEARFELGQQEGGLVREGVQTKLSGA